VSFMVALPLLIAPFRALIGFQSDHHRSHLGWRRVPYIWMGTLMQFGGFSIMPFALLVLSGAGQSAQAPQWVGQFGAAVAFILVGVGMHTTQTAGLALATDLAPQDKQAKVVGLMYVMQLFGMMDQVLPPTAPVLKQCRSWCCNSPRWEHPRRSVPRRRALRRALPLVGDLARHNARRCRRVGRADWCACDGNGA
jgi:hypothetical protein